MDEALFAVGYNKHGEVDFAVSGLVPSLSYEEMRKAREMIVVGIGVFEDMWRRNRPMPSTEKKSE